MPITMNLVPQDPELKDLLELLKKQIFFDLNCHHVGTIQSFDKLTQTASVTVNYKQTYFEKNDATETYDPVLVDYPILLDCPCFVLGGGGGALTFPIRKGDECVVLFNDRDLDTWLKGGTSDAPNDSGRSHAFADGMVLVGLRSNPNALLDYADDAVELYMGDTLIRFDGVDVTVETAGPAGVTATFRGAGGARLQNQTGFFDFKDDADIEFNTGTVQGNFGAGGKVKFLNASGIDLVAALFNLLTTAQAGGFPLILSPPDLVALTSYKP